MSDAAPAPVRRNLGWVVTLAATGIGLALGILYSWSVVKAAIRKDWGWSDAEASLPYSVACLVFAFSTILAGRLQDRFGPRWVSTAGGVLVGLGCLAAGLFGNSVPGFVAGFGVLGGLGIGFGYASATPPSVKWFPKHRTGLIAGIVVSGFGLASVIWAPLATALLGKMGISQTLIWLGVMFFVVVVILSQLLRNPPAGFVPPGTPPPGAASSAMKPADMSWRQMLRDRRFWLLWVMFFLGAGVGLMLIGTATRFGKTALGAEHAFWVVVVLAIGNAGGRILAGTLSDRIGRQQTLLVAFVVQAVMVVGLIFLTGSPVILLLIVAVAGANYGSNLALFPAASKDYFGLRSFGLNYGFLFTAWGVGGFVLSTVNGLLVDALARKDAVTGKVDDSLGLTVSLAGCAVLLVLAAAMTFLSRAAERRAP